MRIVPEIRITLYDISKALCLPQKKESAKPINAITTDSREVISGDLFVALRGDLFNGEDFIGEARERGAYILSESGMAVDFKVEDTYRALLSIASYYKSKLTNLKKTIAITGSVGKTTTKNILAGMLSNFYKVHKTYENYNNFLGLAHTILTTPGDSEILIAELGMNHPGEISLLSLTLKPDISVITNVGTAHIGILGNREAIAKAKLEIADGMTEKIIIIPKDEPLLMSASGKYTFSLTSLEADCHINLKEESAEYSTFDVHTQSFDITSCKISTPGRHILSAVSACIGVLDLLGARKDEVLIALGSFDNSCVRGRFLNVCGFTFYDDSYSSSPEAVISNLKLLSLYKPKRLACVLGDMLELGERSEALHREIGRCVFEYGFDKLFTFGANSRFTAEGAMSAGMRKDKIFVNSDINNPELTAIQIARNCFEDEIILCKASHSVRIDRIYEYIKSAMKG